MEETKIGWGRAGFTEKVSFKPHLKDKKELSFRKKKMCELGTGMCKSIPGRDQQMQRPWDRTEFGTYKELKEGSPAKSKGEHGKRWGGRVQPGTSHPGHAWLLGSSGWYFILGEMFKVFNPPLNDWEKVICREAGAETIKSVSNSSDPVRNNGGLPRIGGSRDA